MLGFGSLLIMIRTFPSHIIDIKAHFVYAPGKWETTLQCNVSYWLAHAQNDPCVMAGDRLASPGARASAVMVLTKFA